MDKRYEVYALADRHFYETPDRLSSPGADASASLYGTERREVPEGWSSARIGDWLTLTPLDEDGGPLPGPAQGWKVHASATRANADRIATLVWDYCVPRRIPFKFVPGPHLLHLRNTKYAGRDTSGKFVTVYPSDKAQLHEILRELGRLLAGFEGPYILTDLRWYDGPLYVRYGAFARSFVVDERGSLVPAVRDGEGRLVPDRRAPSFQVPEWETLPAFLEPHLVARNTTTVGELPYRIEKALHFSNGGGVYAGTDTRDGRKVVLKEGRPHAGLASDGADAIVRLEREKGQNLSSDLHGGLAGLGLVLGQLAADTGESELRERAAEAADILVRRLAEPRPATPRRRAGLLRGASGPALFLLRRAVMARAGHPPPLLRRPDGRVRVLDLAGGPLLGIDADATYPTTEVDLAPGSVLVLYTDGLIESPGVDIEDALAELGQRLAGAGNLPLEEIADELVRHSAAARERIDDVALLLLRAREPGRE
nr:SpoIIE family protein phosphatase [Streptomyces sp. NBC_00886]